MTLEDNYKLVCLMPVTEIILWDHRMYQGCKTHLSQD